MVNKNFSMENWLILRKPLANVFVVFMMNKNNTLILINDYQLIYAKGL
ncbi:hypothetical protein [Caldisphaera lagunensis]|nr:hypothetical protein [Caldisphaera lagunensis]